MINREMEIALNKQINLELWSGYLYFSMSFDMNHKGFLGIAKRFETQAREEVVHAQMIGAHISNLKGKVLLSPIAEVRQDWGTPHQASEDALLHEKFITKTINALYEKAVELKQYPTVLLLQWFITEQVEEESSQRTMLETLTKIDDNSAAMYIFDAKMGECK